MLQEDFQRGFPGRIVPATFVESDGGAGSRTVSGVAFVPDPLPPEIDWERLVGRLYHDLDRTKSALLRLESTIGSLPSRMILLQGMLAREAQVSSRIENTFSSLRDMAIAESDKSRVGTESVDVVRNKSAIAHGIRSKLPMSLRLVREMHEILIVESAHTPGEFRRSQVCIGDEAGGFKHARFVPPPAPEVGRCMNDWERFCNPAPEESGRVPDLVRLALAHYQFEAIHPFSDGNGRLGRALVNVHALKGGLVREPVCNLSEWVYSNRQGYYDGLLAVSTRGDWEGWIRFFCSALREQAGLDLERARRLEALHKKYIESVTSARRSILLKKLIDHVFERPAVTVSLAAGALGVSYTAAQRHVATLVEHGVLRPLGRDRYDKLYIAEGVLRAIRGRGED